MFTKPDFIKNMADLRQMEEKMRDNYAQLVDQIEDEELELQFTALMQSEKQHVRLIDRIEEIVNKTK